MEKASFMSAAKAYFGSLPGQSLMQFMHEVRAVDKAGQKEIALWLNDNGHPCVIPE